MDNAWHVERQTAGKADPGMLQFYALWARSAHPSHAGLVDMMWRQLCLCIDLHHCRLELSRWDPLFKQNVQLVVTAVLELGETKVCPDEHGGTKGDPEEGGLALPVDCGGELMHQVGLRGLRAEGLIMYELPMFMVRLWRSVPLMYRCHSCSLLNGIAHPTDRNTLVSESSG